MAKRFLTLDDVVAEAMSIIPGDTSEVKLYAKTHAYRGLRQFGPSKNNIDVCTLYPEDFVLRKPDDFIQALDIALYDASGNKIPSKYQQGKDRIFGKKPLTVDPRIDISEDDHFFYLSTDATNVDQALLRYYKHPVDKDGNPQFPDYLVFPISLFLRYTWAMSQDSGVRDARESWLAAKKEAKGEHKQLSPLEFEQIARGWNSMIQKVNHDSF